MNDLINKYYEEEITKAEFEAEFSNHYDADFTEFMSRNIEFGSIETLEQGIKEFGKVVEIKKAVDKVFKISRSKIMKRAWQIAREGVSKFGGKVKEYFAMSLKIAWAEAKN